jgi:hypothetical protein
MRGDEDTRSLPHLCSVSQRQWKPSPNAAAVQEEWVREEGCWFRVLRHSRCPRIFSCSFWVSPQADGRDLESYANVTLVNSIYWWVLEFPSVVQASRFSRLQTFGTSSSSSSLFHIRFYVDSSIRLNDPIGSLTWSEMFHWMTGFEHVELFFYDCPIAPSHPQTFGSLLRLHALTDPSVEWVAIRNLEALTSVQDLDHLHRWWIRESGAKNGAAKPWVFSAMTTTAIQHKVAREWLVKTTQQLRPNELGSGMPASFSPGFCLCSMTIVQHLGTDATTRLFGTGGWSEILRLAREWNKMVRTSTDWLLKSKKLWKYGVDEFVMDAVLFPLLVRSPRQMTIFHAHYNIGQFVESYRKKEWITSEEWKAFMRRYGSRQLSNIQQTIRWPLAEQEMKFVAEGKGHVSRSDYPNQQGYRHWLPHSYRFAAAVLSFLRKRARPRPLSHSQEAKYVDQLVEYELDQARDTILLRTGQKLLFEEERKAPSLPPHTTAKRRAQLEFWASRHWAEMRLIMMPGWGLKPSAKHAFLHGEMEQKAALRHDFQLATSELVRRLVSFPLFRIRRPPPATTRGQRKKPSHKQQRHRHRQGGTSTDG